MQKKSSSPRQGKKFQPKATWNTEKTFANLLTEIIQQPAAGHTSGVSLCAPLAHLDYEQELEVKNEALRRFWAQHKLTGTPEPVLASPLPRGYRTTSKRSAIFQAGKVHLLLSETKKVPARFASLQASTLEPAEHAHIFSFLHAKLSEPAFHLVANHLNFLIIRGNYAERVVIFNVNTLNGPLVRKLKILATHLQSLPDPPTAAFIYPDPTGSEYYLEERRPANLLHWKKLYGKDYLTVKHLNRRYHFHPTSFSQINESIVPAMLEKAQELLAPAAGECLIDLYCGYGLFSHYFAPMYVEVLGIDAEGPSIRAAVANKKLNPDSGNTRFVARRITEISLEESLPLAASRPEVIILDPPRQGAPEEVIETLARRGPRKVLHVHCGVDQIPGSLKAWRRFGYQIRRVAPLDMFPGSANLETLILLSGPS